MKKIPYFLFLFLLSACQPNTSSEETVWLADAPAGERFASIDPSGKTILPNGRIIKPFGKTVRTAPHPFGLSLSPDGKIAVTANSGTRPFSISIIDQMDQENPRVRQIPEGANNDEGLLEAVFMGLAITPDNQSVYVAGGEANKIFQFNLENGNKIDSIDCAVLDGNRDYTDGYIGDLVLTKDGGTLYAVDQIGFRMLIIDTKTKTITANIPTGRYPFGLSLSPDERKAYVANVGMFEYSFLGQIDPNDPKGTGADYPTSAFGSKEMIEGYTNDSIQVPGLGDPNVPASFSVWSIDLEQQKVTAKIKTGFLVGEKVEGIPAVGGSSPNSLVATDQYVFVSNGNNDCISVIDWQQDTIVQHIFLSPDERLAPYRGVIPFGLALSPDQKRLYVAEAGINAVAVIDAVSLEVLGRIPVGWFPSKLAVTPDGKQLIVANAKGFGSGPNGGADYEVGPEGTYIGSLMKGSVTIMDLPTDKDLARLSQEVLSNNFNFKKAAPSPKQAIIPSYGGASESPIKYIVFISKENRTYDDVFGQIKGGKGDPTLARYGANRSFAKRDGSGAVAGVTVMKNHLALAAQYAICDNFYVDADVSADGHRWLVNTYPNEWVETHVAASYGGKRSFNPGSKAPGKFGFVGSSGAIYPEDYNEAGSLWDHLERNNVDFYNFGFGVEMAATYADSTLKYTGVKYLSNFPIPGPLYDRSSRAYPTYNMAIPDQFRADRFIAEMKEKYLDANQEIPQLLTVLLPNDHGAGERPQAGYPYRESYMMDNDLALGRIIEFLSHTPYWKNMAVFVTMDDAQDGQDHIDAHRSILMVISPYAKKNYVGHQHYSFGSIFKTFWNILGLPPMNQYDAGATDLNDLFQAEADVSPYQAYPLDPRVFDPQKVLDPFDENFDWKAVMESPELDNIEDFQEAHKKNQ
jgi:YVTN family beta-propeller protein